MDFQDVNCFMIPRAGAFALTTIEDRDLQEHAHILYVSTVVAARFPIWCSVPTRRQKALHVLRSLIDALVPIEAGLLAKGSHGLNELIDLTTQQCFPGEQ